jgi:magnesium-transporting ATPase (P-type)
MFTMRTAPDKSEAEPTPSKPANAKPPDIALASVPDALAALHVNPDTGLTHAEVDLRRKEHGYNEVAERKGHPVLNFLWKFWGISAWMLELIMVLSAVFGPRRGEHAAGDQRRVELPSGASGRRCG